MDKVGVMIDMVAWISGARFQDTDEWRMKLVVLGIQAVAAAPLILGRLLISSHQPKTALGMLC